MQCAPTSSFFYISYDLFYLFLLFIFNYLQYASPSSFLYISYSLPFFSFFCSLTSLHPSTSATACFLSFCSLFSTTHNAHPLFSFSHISCSLLFLFFLLRFSLNYLQWLSFLLFFILAAICISFPFSYQYQLWFNFNYLQYGLPLYTSYSFFSNTCNAYLSFYSPTIAATCFSSSSGLSSTTYNAYSPFFSLILTAICFFSLFFTV